MYSSRGASRVPLYLHEAFKGNFSPFADFLIRWRADGTFDGLYLSITCAEDVPLVAPDAAERDDPTSSAAIVSASSAPPAPSGRAGPLSRHRVCRR